MTRFNNEWARQTISGILGREVKVVRPALEPRKWAVCDPENDGGFYVGWLDDNGKWGTVIAENLIDLAYKVAEVKKRDVK